MIIQKCPDKENQKEFIEKAQQNLEIVNNLPYRALPWQVRHIEKNGKTLHITATNMAVVKIIALRKTSLNTPMIMITICNI